MENSKELSKCCKKVKVSNYTDEGTGCYLCSGCLREFIPVLEEEKKCDDCGMNISNANNENCVAGGFHSKPQEPMEKCYKKDCKNECYKGETYDFDGHDYCSEECLLTQEPMEWESEFTKQFGTNQYGGVQAHRQDLEIPFIKNLLSSQSQKLKEKIIKEIKEKGLHLGYANDIINIINKIN